jgi:purine nucleosidase
VAKTQIIIDCDPGVDDAVALFLAFAAREELDILAITTVAGNVSAQLTARNARLIRQIAGRENVPVHSGCERPMVRVPVEAGHFHGESGLGSLAIFEPTARVGEGHAVNVIVETIMSRPPGTVSLAVTGPMTNLAMAMVLQPAIIPRLGTVVAMGGARSEGGNITASAEYNIYADPHAAHVVISSGAPVVMLGLDATHQVRATAERTAAIAALDTPASRTLVELLAFAWEAERLFARGEPPPQHDACTIAYLLAPELFTAVPCALRVETASELTLGHTAVEFRLADPAAATVKWVTQVDAQGMFDLLTERLSR